MQIKDWQGNIRKANDLAPDIDQHIREALGWLLHRQETTVLRMCARRKSYHAYVEGGRELLGDIRPSVVHALLKLGIINVSPNNAYEAVGNPEFLAKNPEWKKYIPRPRAADRQPPR